MVQELWFAPAHPPTPSLVSLLFSILPGPNFSFASGCWGTAWKAQTSDFQNVGSFLLEGLLFILSPYWDISDLPPLPLEVNQHPWLAVNGCHIYQYYYVFPCRCLPSTFQCLILSCKVIHLLLYYPYLSTIICVARKLGIWGIKFLPSPLSECPVSSHAIDVCCRNKWTFTIKMIKILHLADTECGIIIKCRSM